VGEVTDENAIREKRSNGHVDETKACETGKSIHQTNESVMPYPPTPLLSNVIRLLAFSMVALDRSTVLMALLAHKPAKERRRTRDRRTNGDGETKDPERKKPRQKNEGALFYRCERTRRITGRKGKGRGWKEPKAPREGAWWGVVKFVEGWFLLNLYFINYVPESRTPKTSIRARIAFASFHFDEQ